MATDDYARLLAEIRQWPAAKQLALAEDLIRSVHVRSTSSQRATLERARGLLATDLPGPTDAECAQIVGAARDEKYDAVKRFASRPAPRT